MYLINGAPRRGIAAAFALAAFNSAADGFIDSITPSNISMGGFIRQETAVSSVSEGNPSNQGGNVFENRTATRQAYVPPALQLYNIANPGSPVGAILNPILGGNSTTPIGTWGDVAIPTFNDSVRRGDFVPKTNNALNYVVLRAETEVSVKFGEHLELIGRLRALYQPDVYDSFNAHSLDNVQGGLTGGDPGLYHGGPNFYDYRVEGGKKPNNLEWTGKNYLVYFPALVLNYHSGGLNVRIGNQQIAWGQAIFLRTFDVPNGMDYRRHLIIDRALEEFSEKRVPELTVRIGYQVTDEIVGDVFVSRFSPTIYPNPNTPYNVIPAQFTVHDRFLQDGDDRKIETGVRFKADYGSWGWQAAFVSRFNPDGVFRWTQSGVNKPLFSSGPTSLANVVNTAYDAKPSCATLPSPNPALCRSYANSGDALSHSPFEASPGGVYSSNEWFNYAAQVRLDGVSGLNASINDFRASQELFATPVDNSDQAAAELNTFFMASGGSLRGHIERKYFRENLAMLGGSYVNESSIDFLNELIFNLEAQYTPKRTFTSIDLGQNFKKTDEYTVSLVADKWHRFFKSFPGTYIVFEALTKNRSDLVGRQLSGYNASEQHAVTGRGGTNGINGGLLGKNATYFVFGFLQPWPNKIYELEFATLYDVHGGILAQPGLRWHPGHGFTVEGFYNYVNGHMSGNPNNNLLSTLDFAQEFTLRLSYQF